MPLSSAETNYINSINRRLENLGGKVDSQFKQLDAFLRSGGASGMSGLGADAPTAAVNQSKWNAMVQRVNSMEQWLRIYDQSTSQIAVRPERSVPATVTDKRTGSTYVNPVKEVVKPFTIRTNPTTVTIPANGTSYIKFQVPAEENLRGDAEIFSLMLTSATSTSFRVKFTHTGRNQFLQNNPIHSMTAFGNMLAGPQPFVLYESIFLEPGQELLMELTDFSQSPNTVEIEAQARRFLGYDTSHLDRAGLINMFYSRMSFPFWLTSDTQIVLPSGVAGQSNINFTVDQSFDIEAGKNMAAGSNSSTGAAQVVPCHIQLQEGRSGRLLTDGAVHILSLFGTSNFPIINFEPLLIKRGTTLRAQINNDVNGFANNQLDLVFHGRALPYRLPDQRTLETTSGGVNANVPFPLSQKNVAYKLGVPNSTTPGAITS